MKLFGVILLTSYFLVREKEGLCRGREGLAALIREWTVYLICAGFSVFIGLLLDEGANSFRPAALLLAAALPAILFKGRPVCMVAGAATAFCVLRGMPDVSRVAVMLLAAEAAVLIAAFLYMGARQRMLRLNLSLPARKSPGRLLMLFSLSVLLVLVYQKMIQIF